MDIQESVKHVLENGSVHSNNCYDTNEETRLHKYIDDVDERKAVELAKTYRPNSDTNMMAAVSAVEDLILNIIDQSQFKMGIFSIEITEIDVMMQD
jgi:hypothetical protein